jgi:hypothetical protein
MFSLVAFFEKRTSILCAVFSGHYYLSAFEKLFFFFVNFHFDVEIPVKINLFFLLAFTSCNQQV